MVNLNIGVTSKDYSAHPSKGFTQSPANYAQYSSTGLLFPSGERPNKLHMSLKGEWTQKIVVQP
jgi:hypothetical protein